MRSKCYKVFIIKIVRDIKLFAKKVCVRDAIDPEWMIHKCQTSSPEVKVKHDVRKEPPGEKWRALQIKRLRKRILQGISLKE